MADFPAGRSSDVDAIDVIAAIITIVLVIAWLLSGIALFHGLFTKDLWEALTGGVLLLVFSAIFKGLGRLV